MSVNFVFSDILVWQHPRCRAGGCQRGGARGGGYRVVVPGVWGTGRWSTSSGVPWYGSGSGYPRCTTVLAHCVTVLALLWYRSWILALLWYRSWLLAHCDTVLAHCGTVLTRWWYCTGPVLVFTGPLVVFTGLLATILCYPAPRFTRSMDLVSLRLWSRSPERMPFRLELT